MRQEDAQVQHIFCYLDFKVESTVDDGQRQPAQSKQEENQKKGLCCLKLPSIKCARFFGGRKVLTEFVPDDVENVQINGTHDNQGDEDPGEKAEEDHVLHTDNTTERTNGDVLEFL